MATEALKSEIITYMDATPPNYATDRALRGGVLRMSMQTIECTAKDAASTYRMVRVPSSAFIYKVELAADDLGTTPTLGVGVYQTAENGGAVVNVDLFASAVDVNAAAVARTDVTFESTEFTISDINKPLWEVLGGMTVDPLRDYDIVVTSAAAVTSAGTISLWVTWVG